MTLKQFFNKYPVSKTYIAEKMGVDRSTLSKKASGDIPMTQDELKQFQSIVNEMGDEMSKLKFEI